MLETKITDNNRLEFYRRLYPVSTMKQEELFDLTAYLGTVILFDCAGSRYQEAFPNKNIIKIENLETCKSFKLDKSNFDHIFTTEKFPDVRYPNSTLVLDHSPFLKYQTKHQLKITLETLSNIIDPSTILLRINLGTAGDDRFSNRIQNFIDITPQNFITVEFDYSVEKMLVCIKWKKKKNYDIN